MVDGKGVGMHRGCRLACSLNACEEMLGREPLGQGWQLGGAGLQLGGRSEEGCNGKGLLVLGHWGHHAAFWNTGGRGFHWGCCLQGHLQ